MDERTFQGYVLTWLGEILDDNPTLPFVLPEQERRPKTLRKPGDIILRDRDNPEKIAVVGELKLPDAPDGSAPDRRDVLQKTLEKANEFRANWYFTWNVNDLMLWDNSRGAVPLLERRFDHLYLPPDRHIFDRDELDDPDVLARYKPFLHKFLETFARYYTREVEIALKPADRQFAISLHVNLRPVIGALHRDLLKLSQEDRAVRTTLQRYMAEALGWIPREAKFWSDEVYALARLCAYLLANKLIFYETLRRNFSGLDPLRIDPSVRRGSRLASILDDYFEQARIASKDYEPVFHGVHYGKRPLTTDSIPFLGDRIVAPLRDLAERIAEFNLAKLDHEIVGRIYQEVNDPHERHRFGQHYTLPEIVDLINAFCISSPTDKVLDPACGGGTFLVRAYARKKYLARKAGQALPTHSELLQQLFGVDIAPHAAHLTTVNLATQALLPERNYPLVDHKDFFDLEPESKIAHGWLPKGLDAVVTNPPYTRQELIEDKLKRKIYATLVQDAREWLRDFGTVSPSRRSDIYLYFFLHSAPFIRERGYIGFITSNSWLNALYGVPLQKFFLDNFRMVAILESKVERWFSGAAIITAVTILQHERDEQKRNENVVKFVRFFTPLEKLFPPTRDEDARLAAVERLVESIERCNRLTTTPDYRINPVRQADLLADGAETDPETGITKYVGGKWGKYLWAPDVFFKILERAGDRLCKLSQVATVRYGILTGSNDFFYVKDITDELSDHELRRSYGLTRRDTKRLRVIEDGNGTAHIIEAEFLKPVITSPKEIARLTIDPPNLPYRVLIVHKDKKQLEGTHVIKYIKLGEIRRFGGAERGSVPAKNPSCQFRERWYDLGPVSPAPILIPETNNERVFAVLNRASALADQRLVEIVCDDAEVIAAPLMSSFGALVAELYGRISLGEGGLDLPASDVAKLLTVIPAALPQSQRQKLANAAQRLASRAPASYFEECLLPDRRALDDAVLEAFGFADPHERARVRDDLVAGVRDLLSARLARAIQLAGIPEELQPRARKQVNVPAVAAELWQDFDTSTLRRFPSDFLPETDKRLVVEKLDFAEGEIEVHGGLYGAGEITIGSQTYSLGAVSRAEFAKYAIEATGLRTVEIPTDPNICLQAVKAYEAYIAQLRSTFRSLAETRTSDPKLIRKLEDELMRLAALHTCIQ